MTKNKALGEGPIPHEDRPEGLHHHCECGEDSTTFSDPFKKGFTRRRVLQGTTAFAAGLAVQPLTAKYAFAAPDKPMERVLINLAFRGGADQNTLFPLLGFPAYKSSRPTIAETDQTAFPLDRGVAALNEWTTLHATLGAGMFGYVPAADSQDRTHSHFQAMDLLEGGLNTPASDGWAARALKLLPNPAVLTAVMVGGTLPKSLDGSGALTLDRIESFGLNGGDEVKAKSAAVLQQFYKQYKDPVAQTALETLNAIKTIGTMAKTEYKPAVDYPQSGTAQAFKTAAQLIKAKVGLRYVNIDVGGWDTHTSSKGQIHDHAKEINDALTAFFKDLGPAIVPFVSLLTTTEFGRTSTENGSQGTDHGHAQGVMVLGGGSTGGVRGGAPVFGTSGPDNETRGTTDLRDVLTEGLTWLGVKNPASVFTDHKFKAAGTFRK